MHVVEHPEIREAVAKKDEQLAGFLKGMIVNPERMAEVQKSTVFTFTLHHFVVNVDELCIN